MIKNSYYHAHKWKTKIIYLNIRNKEKINDANIVMEVIKRSIRKQRVIAIQNGKEKNKSLYTPRAHNLLSKNHK